MTSAVPDHPSTTLDLLFGPGEDAPGALAHQILSAGTGGNLGRALESLPTATRQAAVREATTAAAGLLDVDLLGLLVAGWREHHDLTAAARRTLGSGLMMTRAARRGRLVAGSLPDLLLRAAVGQADPGRGGFPRADVGGQVAEQGAERRQVCVGEARSQLGVEGGRGVP